MTPVYVVIPFKDQIRMTKNLIAQLEEQGEYERLFLMDNGSFGWIPKSIDAKGKNIHQMWNAGLDLARASSPDSEHYVAILNNDLKIGPNFLSGLAQALDDDPSLGVVCPNYDNRPEKGVVYTNQIAAGRTDGTGGLAGFAFMLRGSIGYRFPEELHWWYGDNHMLATLIVLNNYGAGIVTTTQVTHIDGGSQTARNWLSDEYARQIREDRDWWKGWVRQASKYFS